jgi:DNA-binding CsgD family transcriptional regulator
MPAEGRNWLYDQVSVREAEVAARCARLMKSAEIAADLGIRKSTVDDHIRRVYGLLGGRDRRDVALWWQAEGEAYLARLRERLLLDDPDDLDDAG